DVTGANDRYPFHRGQVREHSLKYSETCSFEPHLFRAIPKNGQITGLKKIIVDGTFAGLWSGTYA
ncbi:MAG: hypothetical protein ACXW0U_07075, partial [Halobacteriota archaeon]